MCIHGGGFGGWTANCCAEGYMALISGVSEARGSCYRCLSVMFLLFLECAAEVNATKCCFIIQPMAQKS